MQPSTRKSQFTQDYFSEQEVLKVCKLYRFFSVGSPHTLVSESDVQFQQSVIMVVIYVSVFFDVQVANISSGSSSRNTTLWQATWGIFQQPPWLGPQHRQMLAIKWLACHVALPLLHCVEVFVIWVSQENKLDKTIYNIYQWLLLILNCERLITHLLQKSNEQVAKLIE